MQILITGGAGFVGSSLAKSLKAKYPGFKITCLDNLKRRGSELNIEILKNNNIKFIHGDIRNKEDFNTIGPIDFLIECSAEPSVLAGYDGDPSYLLNTNLTGTINCLEYARKNNSKFIFLSTSRVYPIGYLNSLSITETGSRFELDTNQNLLGISAKGISESFPLDGARSLYGSTKLASELIIQEYNNMYGIKTVINRCGVLAGPGQFGKSDQGVVALWLAKHHWRQKLNYIGYGGFGKQVRDILHIEDLFDLIDYQVNNIESLNGAVMNVGGGRDISVSLQELTSFCEECTKKKIEIGNVTENREADIPVYITDTTKVHQLTTWTPKRSIKEIVYDTYSWMLKNEKELKLIMAY